MNGSKLMEQLQDVRQRTLSVVENLSDAQLDVVPPGFRNSIRWNLGHVFVSQEKMVFTLAGEENKSPEGYISLFAGGTAPSMWEESSIAIPTLEEITTCLRDQPGRIQEQFAGRLGDPLAEPFKAATGIVFATVEEVIHFSIYHEGLHTGVIMSLKKMLQ
jgi:uncharacterized damage-inducible protein DinB